MWFTVSEVQHGAQNASSSPRGVSV